MPTSPPQAGATPAPSQSAPLRVSVALATCDGARYLAEQLDSIATQSRPPQEVVVVDDASTDASPQIVRAWAGRAPCAVRVERNPVRLGSTRTFERALALCSGDVMFLADQDDVWLPDKLEVMCRPFERSPQTVLVHGDARVVDAQLRPLRPSLFAVLGIGAQERRAEDRGDAFGALLRRNLVTGACCAVRRTLVERARPFDPALVHDDWLALHAALFGRLVRLDRPVILYRQHGGNQIGAPQRRRARRLAQLWQRRAQAREVDVRRLTALAARLAVLGRDVPEPARTVVAGALALAQARAALPAARWRRLPAVLGWWLAGRYGRYTRGARTALGDLLERADPMARSNP